MPGAMTVASLMVQIGADLQPLNKGLGTAQKALGGFAKAGAALGGMAVAGIAAAGGAVTKLAIDAAPLEAIRTSFDNLAVSIGEDPVKALAALREASRGMITDTELIKSFNEAVMLAGDAMGKDLPALLQIAQASAAATGQDMGFMLDSLVKGIGRTSPMILDNLGLTIDLSEAYDAYAETVGKTAAELSKAEQQQAVLNAVVAQGDEFIAKMGGEMGGSQVAMAQLSTTVGNLKDSLGTALLPALTAILTPLSAWATEHGPAITAWGMEFADWVITKGVPALQTLAGFIITDIIPPLVQLAEAVFPLLVQAGAWVAENWDVVQYAAAALGIAILALTSPITAIIVVLAGLYLAWVNDWGGIKTFVLDTIESIKGALDSVGAKVEDMKAIGKSLIEGLWNGLESMKEWLKSKLEAIAGWLPQWIKDRLGISSPSRVFMELGANMMQGMAAGITQNATSVTRALGSAVSGFSGPTLAGAGAAAGGSPTIIVVNLDRRDFEGPDGELDYLMLGERIMKERLY